MRKTEVIQADINELRADMRGFAADIEAGKVKDEGYAMKRVNKASHSLGALEQELKEAESVRKSLSKYSGGTEVNAPVSQTPFAEGSPIVAASPMDMTQEQVHGLMAAAEHKTPYSVEIQPKSFRFRDSTQTKAAVTEGGLGGSFSGNLPPVQSLYAVGLGYEPTRIADLLPGAAMPGPSATWLSHTANGAEVGVVAEAGTKGDISPTITENQVKPTKIAGQVSVTLEAWQDTEKYGEGQFAAWLPTELTRSLINEESNLLLNAVSGTGNATFNGILQTSGTLTRAVGTDSPLDALAKAYTDLRTGSAFADPDLVLMHPTTLGALRRAKNSDGNYILDLLAGPLNLTAYGQPSTAGPANEPNAHSLIPQGSPASSGSLWGADIKTSTQIAAGTAVVMSVKAGAGIFWQRLGMLVMFNPYSLMTTNEYLWIAEERIAYSCQRPAAVNIVTGLPTA